MSSGGWRKNSATRDWNFGRWIGICAAFDISDHETHPNFPGIEFRSFVGSAVRTISLSSCHMMARSIDGYQAGGMVHPPPADMAMSSPPSDLIVRAGASTARP